MALENKMGMEIELEIITKKLDEIVHEIGAITERVASIENSLAMLVAARAETDVGQNILFSLKDAADFLHLSVSRIYALIYQKKLTPFQTSKNSRILFSKDELDNYLSKTGSKV